MGGEEDDGKDRKSRVGESGAREDEEWSDERETDAEAPVLGKIAQLVHGSRSGPDVVNQRLENAF